LQYNYLLHKIRNITVIESHWIGVHNYVLSLILFFPEVRVGKTTPPSEAS